MFSNPSPFISASSCKPALWWKDVCVAVGMLRCESTAHLRSELKKVVGRGGEGLMLRKPKSDYVQGRSDVLLKVKNFQDEEAKVMRYQDGKGKHVGKVGALALRTPDGREFLCGSGMTDKDRESPPKIGAVVTYRFPELMNNGYPRHPVFVAPRPDFDWNSYCKEYTKPKKHAPKLKRNHSILYGDGDKKSDGSCSHFETAAAPTSSLSSSSSSETTPTFEQLLLASPPPPSIPSILTEEAVDALKIRALQYALSSYGLSVRGSREALRDRLRKRILDDPTTWDDSKLMGWLSNKRDSDTYLDPVTLVLLCEQQLDGLGFMTLTKAEIQEIGISAPEQIVRVQKTVEELKARAYGK